MYRYGAIRLTAFGRRLTLKYDVIIVGAGPAGIFTALELIKNKPDSKIMIIEKGQSIENRHCPKIKTKKCVHCKPYCHITTGFSGAGVDSSRQSVFPAFLVSAYMTRETRNF